MSKTTKAAVVALASAGVTACVFGAGIASADPTGAPTYRALAGVGSDTTQDVMNALAKNILLPSTTTLAIGSYNATGSAQVQLKTPVSGTDPCLINRPNGSGQGLTAFRLSQAAANNCVDFARSSKVDTTANGSGPGATFVPFAIDAVSYAVTNTSGISRNLTTANLKDIYQCVPAAINNGTPNDPTDDITPLLPQAGSGTRSYFISKLGLTEATIGSCVKDTKAGVPIEEHTGTALDDNSLIPFSIAQYNAQSTSTISDKRGRGVLGIIDGKVPSLENTDFTFNREVYNVIPTAKLAVSPWSDVFVGPNSSVCTNTSIISAFGFGVDPNCGSTATHS